MLTNPNTCGLFEKNIVEIARLVHAAGAYFYFDGANFNAIMGRTRPGELGVDAMHINLHKNLFDTEWRWPENYINRPINMASNLMVWSRQ